MSQSLIALVAGVLNTSPDALTPQSGPATVPAWDSLAHVTIVAAVEEAYGVVLTMPEILAIRSVADLQHALEKHGVPKATAGGAA